jgi:hypothetical protein
VSGSVPQSPKRRSTGWWVGKSRRGGSLVLLVFMFSTLTVFVGMALDVGKAVMRKQYISSACDAAALAGGRELPDASKASAAANQVFSATFSTSIYTVTADSTQVIASVTDSVPTSFARMAGLASISVSASAKSVRQPSPVNEVPYGMAPWAIDSSAYTTGQSVTLKLGGGQGSKGNFYALSLGGTGASNYEDNIKYGYNGLLGTGDTLTASTEPGAMTGPTTDGVQYRIGLATSNPHYASETYSSYSGSNPRILIVPMVLSWVDLAGRTEVTIVGFAAVWLEGINGSNVTGRFVSVSLPQGRVVTTRIAGLDFGVEPVRLTA